MPAVRCAAGGERRSSGSGSTSSSKRGGGGGGKKRGGGSSSKGAQPAGNKQQQPRKKQQEAEVPCLVPSLASRVLSDISSSDRMPEPLWATFCGVSNGLWCGITAAYSPSTGQPEPLALDERGKPLHVLHQCCVEQRQVDDEGVDSVVRHVARAASQEGLQREMAQGGQLAFPGCSLPDAAASVRGGVAECWEEERITHEQDGLVVFDGGSYSLGPAAMGSPAQLPEEEEVEFDEQAAAAAAAALEAALAAPPAADSIELLDDEAEPAGEGEDEEGEEEGPDVDVLALAEQEQPELDWTAVVIEHCMQWGGEQRLRIKVTLDTAGGSDGTELEVLPLRVAVSREAWEGLPGSFTPDTQGAGAAEQQEASRRVKLDADTLSGQWKVFEITAVTVDDISMQTGLPTRSTLYSAHETCRAFGAAPPPGREGGDEGALLLLPHSCGLQLEALRLNNGKRRGVRVSTLWSPQPDMLLNMSRLYDADGRLLEVSTSTAIKDASVC